MKRFFKWTLITLVILFVITILGATVLPRVYKNAVRAELEEEIEHHVNADVAFSLVKLRLLRHFPNLTLSLNDLLIVGKDDFKSDTLAFVKEAQLEVNLWSLVAKSEIAIKSINLLDPEINIYRL